jgi:NAD(P)-dependent dehydrogenase (short-subunit alcohol dehydrogenase family)
MRFDQKVFVVTGGAQGIGRAIAKRLSDEGARVRILDRDARAGRDAADEYGERVTFARCDVGREADVRAAIRAARSWGGRIDGVINNAAIANPEVGPVEKLSLARWQAFLDANLTSMFLVTKHALPHLRRAHGSIVNLASTRALQSEPETIAYAATKGGIVALTHALAITAGPAVRVNCISPGWIATDMYKARGERRVPRLHKKDHAQHPVGRVGAPEDIASLCAWLLSQEAGFVTGANFVVDGGMTRKMIYA